MAHNAGPPKPVLPRQEPEWRDGVSDLPESRGRDNADQQGRPDDGRLRRDAAPR